MTTELVGASNVAAQLRDAAADAAQVALMAKRMRDLAGLLLARGLKVVTRPPVITVSAPGTVKVPASQHYAANRGQAQSVLLRNTHDGLRWFWVRPTRLGHTPELEPLCPGDDIDEAASHIAQALAEQLAAES